MKRANNNRFSLKVQKMLWILVFLCALIGFSGCTSPEQGKLESTMSEQGIEVQTQSQAQSETDSQVVIDTETNTVAQVEVQVEVQEKVQEEVQEEVQTDIDLAKKEGAFELAALQEDFEKLKRYIQNNHPMLYTDKEAMELLLVNQYEKIKEGMTLLEFYRVVAPIVSQLRCGHTFIGLSEKDFGTFIDTSRYLPFNLYWSEGKAYVTQNSLVTELPLGAEVVSINDVPMTEVMAGLFSNMGADGTNETLKRRAINAGFRYHYALGNDVAEQIPINYIQEGAKTSQRLITRAVTKEELDSSGDDFWVEMSQSSRSNLTRFESDYAMLRMATFYPDGGEAVASFNEFIDTFFEDVQQKDIKSVIIDVRDNFGGDPNVAAHLLSYIEKEPIPYFVEGTPYYSILTKPIPRAENSFEGDIYILMNGNSFSTTGHFLALLKYHQIGILIGEESGGSYACTDASSSTTLENTELQYRYSTMSFAVDVDGLTPGRGIMPDYPVVIDYQAISAQEDLELEMALLLIRE